ncbi:hypothetical protein [Burkholderia stagnalis]|uniref:hypothetical protein n=1 Tax=Burkholderia stagnalis TaxID=1503054 RepID=UPI000F55C82D|nr:hypothetical protein [Burkholderia stagnalis]RQQ69162.1 hypothetical protein DF137_14560 [Burkholderia stagnalis]RQR13067.1 hypothetical protein DF025_14355 [Burkholderia stagnalis]
MPNRSWSFSCRALDAGLVTAPVGIFTVPLSPFMGRMLREIDAAREGRKPGRRVGRALIRRKRRARRPRT